MKKSINVIKILIVVVMALATCVAAFSVLTANNLINLPFADTITGLFSDDDGLQPVVVPLSQSDIPDTLDILMPEPPVEQPEELEPELEPERQPVPEITPLSAEVQEWINAYCAENDCTAAQIALINDSYVTNTYSYGYANVARGQRLNDDTVIRVASLSKVLIGMTAMRAQEEGALTLDGTLTDQLGYTVQNPSYTRYPLTLRHILTHTATLNDTASIAGRSLANYLQDRNSYFFSGTPGTAEGWAYSNAGIRAAGGIIEVLTDSTMSELNDRYFFDGLGIDASFYARLLDDTSNIATLYYGNKYVSQSVSQQLARQNFDTPAANCSVFAGGLTITARDYARLMCILLRDGEYDGVQYMTAESVEEMQKVNYELEKYDQCVVIRHKDDLYGRELYFHTGVAYGVLSFAAYDEHTGEGVVIVTIGAYRDGRDDTGVPLVCADLADYLFRQVLDGQPPQE